MEGIDFAQTQQEAWEKEIFYIAKFKSEGLILKNSTLGGDGNRQVLVKQYSKKGEFIKLWSSISEVEKELGLSNSHITSCCKGGYGRKTVGGFVWRYENDSFDKYGSTERKKADMSSIHKKIFQLDFEGTIIKEWNHSQLIENETGFGRTNINFVCRNLILESRNPPNSI